MLTLEPVSQIARDERGVAWVDDTNVKVMELVLSHLAYGWSAETLHEQFPHLSLAQTHAALAYYYDRAEEFERQIRAESAEAAEWQKEFGRTALQQRLERLKRPK